MNIVISALHFAWESMEECLRLARDELGLDGVELSWHDCFEHGHCTEEDLDFLRTAKGEHGLKLATHIWENLAMLGPGPAEEALRRWLGVCRDTGVGGVVLHGGSYPDREAGIERTRQILANVLGEFEQAGVALMLENHYAYDYRDCQELFSEPWEFARVAALDSPALRFCFDTGHAHMTKNTGELLRELGPWLEHVHLADNLGEHDDHRMFRQGTVPWDDIFATLREVGFDGTFCVEFPTRGDQAPFRACVAELRERWA